MTDVPPKVNTMTDGRVRVSPTTNGRTGEPKDRRPHEAEVMAS
jgi:hypothetical protein